MVTASALAVAVLAASQMARARAQVCFGGLQQSVLYFDKRAMVTASALAVAVLAASQMAWAGRVKTEEHTLATTHGDLEPWSQCTSDEQCRQTATDQGKWDSFMGASVVMARQLTSLIQVCAVGPSA